MEQLRVVDLAHTMGITAKELIFKLRSIGVSVGSEEDTLDLSTVRSIITGVVAHDYFEVIAAHPDLESVMVDASRWGMCITRKMK